MLAPSLLIGFAAAKSLSGWVVLAVERAEPARFGKKELATAARETMARTLFALLHPFGRSTPGPDLAENAARVTEGERRTPVLILPELGRNRSSLRFLEAFLRARGFTAVWATNPPKGDRTLAELAHGVEEAVYRLKASTGADKIDIVAHSTGGLLAAWYIRHLGGENHVRRFVTLGCPWKGTRIAVFSRGRIGAEVLYGSPLLAMLAPPPVPTVSIWSPDDPVIIPSSSALPTGVESIRIDGGGHVEMLTSARFFRAAYAALTHDLGPGVGS